MHNLSNSDTGTGLVLALPKMSIQQEKTYFTPAFSKSAFALSMRDFSGNAAARTSGKCQP